LRVGEDKALLVRWDPALHSMSMATYLKGGCICLPFLVLDLGLTVVDRIR
jgi:hypothetical protein